MPSPIFTGVTYQTPSGSGVYSMVYDSYSNYLYAAIGAAIVQLDPVTLLEKSRLDLTGYFMMNRLLTDNAEQDWFVAYIQN